MEDLVNERDLVCQRLLRYNFEPVNAEAFSPTGQQSWEAIRSEIETCHLFLLISGERYGWIPDAGHGSGTNKSVTELEYDEALRIGLPVLAFFKTLPYGAPPDVRRDGFRSRVGDWSTGQLRGEFVVARELAELAGKAVLEVLQLSFFTQPKTERLSLSPSPTLAASPVAPPTDLLKAVRATRVTLWAGAGLSLSAGLPAAAAFTDALVDRLREHDPGYRAPYSGTAFNAVATDFALIRGEDELMEIARSLVGPSWAAPSHSHRIALQTFPQILTTNYDVLLEAAMSALGDTRQVVDEERPDIDLAAPSLVKLHGSIAKPSSVVLTEYELANVSAERPSVWGAVQRLIASQPVLVVGTSLRDPSVIDLFERGRRELRGWVVENAIGSSDRERFIRWGLTPIEADLERFFEAIGGA